MRTEIDGYFLRILAKIKHLLLVFRKAESSFLKGSGFIVNDISISKLFELYKRLAISLIYPAVI